MDNESSGNKTFEYIKDGIENGLFTLSSYKEKFKSRWDRLSKELKQELNEKYSISEEEENNIKLIENLKEIEAKCVKAYIRGTSDLFENLRSFYALLHKDNIKLAEKSYYDSPLFVNIICINPSLIEQQAINLKRISPNGKIDYSLIALNSDTLINIREYMDIMDIRHIKSVNTVQKINLGIDVDTGNMISGIPESNLNIDDSDVFVPSYEIRLIPYPREVYDIFNPSSKSKPKNILEVV